MDSNSKYKSTLAFTDLLFNVLIGFAFLFIVAFILINPITEEANIQAKAEFMVIMEWDPDSSYDIDLWMKDPTGTIVGFPNKDAGWLHLDRDDLGKTNDTILMANGEPKVVHLNREIMTVRGIMQGEHIVNVHFYSNKGARYTGKPIEIMIQVIKINPYFEVYNGVEVLYRPADERTAIRFTVNKNGDVVSKNKLQKKFAGTIDSVNTNISSGPTRAQLQALQYESPEQSQYEPLPPVQDLPEGKNKDDASGEH